MTTITTIIQKFRSPAQKSTIASTSGPSWLSGRVNGPKEVTKW
jgi:hypothetical protein